MIQLIILALVTGALLLSNFYVAVTATSYDAAAELHRSMARYRQFSEHVQAKPVIRNLLQKKRNGEIDPNDTEELLQEEERTGGQKGSNSDKTSDFVYPEPYLLGPTIKDWDKQRAEWLKQNPQFQTSVSKPKVLLVTGSQPEPCRSSTGDYFHIQSLKLKIDYARLHNYEIFYNFAWLDDKMHGYWVKLPVIRKLMLNHPEIEWLFWVDSDAVFTDMLFELPFDTYDGHDMIMCGYDYELYEERLWTAINDGIFLLRNSQWSLDLLDKWSPMGENGPVNVEYGKMLSEFLTGRSHYHGGNYPADDQASLAYLMITDEAVRSKVKLVPNSLYKLSGWWVDTAPQLNASFEKYHPGLGDDRWPFVTHFSGCNPCNGESEDYKKCMTEFNMSYNFADNQILAYMGYQHESLYSSKVKRLRKETGRPLEFVGVNPWKERIAQVAAEQMSGRS